MLVALWQAIPAVRRPMPRTQLRYSFPRHSNPSLSRSAGSTANCRKARLRSRLNSKHPDPFLWKRSTISSVPDNLNLYGSPRNIFLSMPSLTSLPGGKDKSKIILLSDVSDCGTEFSGDTAIGESPNGLRSNGPNMAPNSHSLLMYSSIASGNSLAPLWLPGNTVWWITPWKLIAKPNSKKSIASWSWKPLVWRGPYILWSLANQTTLPGHATECYSAPRDHISWASWAWGETPRPED